ncbi:MAG: flagellin, partial [Deltaproteobacteria bacterium]|nr:flagellin [Deltaproteobacteria bacterium]
LAGGVNESADYDAGTATVIVADLSVASLANAQSAIASVDLALNDISLIRGGLGAIQNRFESTIANLQSVSENISAAKARIMDADFAAETAEMTKAQVLQQAGVAMLAQANQLPQAVLSLLQ